MNKIVERGKVFNVPRGFNFNSQKSECEENQDSSNEREMGLPWEENAHREGERTITSWRCNGKG